MKVLYLLFLLLCLSFCHKQEVEPEIPLPPTPIMTGTVHWGVVNVPYLKVLKEPEDEEHILTILRFGDIVQVTATCYKQHKTFADLWYKVRQEGHPSWYGWVQDQHLEAYSTMKKAKTASALLLEP